jgi:hypothetical protein
MSPSLFFRTPGNESWPTFPPSVEPFSRNLWTFSLKKITGFYKSKMLISPSQHGTPCTPGNRNLLTHLFFHKWWTLSKLQKQKKNSKGCVCVINGNSRPRFAHNLASASIDVFQDGCQLERTVTVQNKIGVFCVDHTSGLRVTLFFSRKMTHVHLHFCPTSPESLLHLFFLGKGGNSHQRGLYPLILCGFHSRGKS